MSLLISLLGSRPSANVEIFETVNTYADLPISATLNKVYQVLTSTGFLINRKVKGLYYYDGTQWQLIAGLEANSVLYNNIDSNLSATNVKAGLDELDGAKEPNIPTGTASQYITGIKTLEELNKDAVGLDQVQNVDQTNATNITTGTLDVARLPNNIDAIKLADGSISNTELQFINSLTSNAQDQINNKEPIIPAGTTSQFYRGDKTFQTIDKNVVGLDQVDNTSDLNKPISTATQNALDNKYDSSNPNNYETPAELNARDTANRQRSNHTGTQAASTISDFNIAVANSPSVSLNTSKISADGSVTTHNDVSSAGSGQIITVAERNNLNNQSGTNTGDETTLSIQTKRPLKTIEGQSIEGAGNIDLTKNDIGLSLVQNVDQTNATNITSGTLSAARLPNNINANKIANGTVSNGKFQFINSLTGNAQDQIDDIINQINLLGAGAPIGSTLFHMAETVPANYLLMNGASLSTTTYSLLFNVIGYKYGGSGNSFNLPNAFHYGNASGVYLRACLSGEVGNIQNMAIQSHTHSMSRLWSFFDGSLNIIKQGDSQGSFNQTINTGSTGGGETRPKTMKALLIIKYQ